MLYVCFYLLANAFMVYGYFCFFHVYFDCSRIDRKQELLFYSIFFLLTSTAYLLFQRPQFVIPSNLLSLFLIVSIYPGRVRSKLLACISSYAFAMMLDSLSYALFIRLHLEENLEAAMGTLFPAMGLFTLSIILKRVQIPRPSDQLNLLNWLAIFLLSAGSILIMTFTLFINDRIWSIFVTAAVLVVTNIIVFHLLDVFERYYQSLSAKQLLEQQSQAYANELMLIRQSNQKISIIRHDLAHHLMAIRHFTETGETEKLVQYLDTFSGKLKESNEYIHSGNLELDAILNYKLGIAADAGADINASVQLPEQLGIDFFDINIMLGNLLDNAISGLGTSEEKNLLVEIGVQMGVLYIKVENSYDGTVRRGEAHYLTRKKDENSHGLGLSSVEHIVEKYQGQMHVDPSNHIFKVGIILYLPS
ncbi:GHKL domain-containing protein [Enterocloster sp. OA13]|uniref:sensor histidine kinase n=1 Tax=Enterocloster sp. OA13 TaxID=2914161 RepID=UPI00047120FD|nr:GHKL domain-containing protein [Enterocloster sp. OA13]